MGDDAVVDGDDQVGMVGGDQVGDAGNRKAVPMTLPVGNKGVNLSTQPVKGKPENGCRRNAVGVVVAVDGDSLFLVDCLGEASDGLADWSLFEPNIPEG